MAMVKAKLVGQSEIMGPMGYWYPGETWPVAERQLAQLTAQYGDVFVMQEAAPVAVSEPLTFGAAGAGAEAPVMAADVAAGKRRK